MSNSRTRSIRLLLLALAASAFSTLGLSGCNTTPEWVKTSKRPETR